MTRPLLSLLVALSLGVAAASEPPTPTTAERVQALLARIDDNPDPLHADWSPAVDELIQVGEPALRPTLDLMLSDRSDTRLRAQRVVEGVTMNRYGFVRGQGWKKEGGEEAFRKLWADLGGLHWWEPQAKREASIALWKKWLANRN